MTIIKQFFTHIFASLKKAVQTVTTQTAPAIIFGSLLIAISIIINGIIIGGVAEASDTSEPKATMFTGKQIDDTEYVFGNKKADVIVIEYSDPECPFCVQVSPTIKEIQNKYADKIAFVYRHFPLTQIHPHAFDESRAISCAGVVGGEKVFHEYLDNFFTYKYSRQTTQLPANGVVDIAKNVGIDVNAFTKCLATQATAQLVNDQQADGVKAGVQGTPSTFILVKGKKGYEVVAMIDGARPVQAFTTAIDEALKR
jgi:protein-disulfide isomerase